jgi:type IV pilus assembly protein PilX
MSLSIRISNYSGATRQRGAVLFVALIFLILLTLLGLAASGNSVLQERMTGGVRNRQLAMLGSESAARWGEAMIWNAPRLANYSSGGMVFPSCLGTGVPQPCVWDQAGVAVHATQRRSVVDPFRTQRGWPTAGSISYTPALSGLTGTLETASITAQPRLMFEDLGFDHGGDMSTGRMGGAIEQERGGSTRPLRHLYRVTARSQGGNGEAAVRVTEVVYSAYSTGGSFTSN